MIAINDSNGADQPTGKKISLNLLDKQPAGEESTGGSCGSGGSCGCGPTEEQAPQVVQLNTQTFAADRKKPRVEHQPFAGTEQYPEGLMVGMDVGSTTVKAVVVDIVTDEILWKDYQRHDTKQPEKVLEFLGLIEARFPDVPRNAFRLFITGSGGANLVKHIGGKFVQEVNAVSLAVEKLYPEVQSVVELGGQDAKIIIFKEDEETGKKKKIPSMNDKCAGGTGAVIDKINAKLKIPAEQLCEMGYRDLKLHPVAGKCGVFAETDINGLQKQGVPPDELMASLFESIIQQNMSVLTRGHTLRPTVLLLGGPNCYIKGMRDCWRENIPAMWKERGVKLPDPDKAPEDYIITPDNAQYFAAIGAVEFAKTELDEDANAGLYLGREMLNWYIAHGRAAEKAAAGSRGLARDAEELAAFKDRYRKQPWSPTQYAAQEVVEAFVGLDGGSTSTKAVLVDRARNVIAKAYQLSKGNPIEDSMEILGKLEEQVVAQGARLKILGVGTTGYAKDILKDVLGGDVALVETVAHTESGLHFYPGTDVIVDVGGQDIKLIILRNGAVKDFKLNTQCSAGNGYFLQSTATGFGFKVEDYADLAFQAEQMPEFGYGCAVFMQSDIVDFQRQGWQPNEIMAGLAAVLPKNIWLYVSQIPNIAKLGTKFVLQGGTQHNLAAVKAQVDFIESRFVGTGLDPEVIVHQHCGESGAIGCALEAQRLWAEQGLETTFIGFDKVRQIEFRTTRDESTRCYFCKNKCLRTFIDVKTGAHEPPHEDGVHIDLASHMYKSGPEAEHPTRVKFGHDPVDAPADVAASSDPSQAAREAVKRASTKSKSKVPLHEGEQRLIIATCEKGTVEDVADMREIKSGLDAVKQAHPNLIEIAAREVFRAVDVAPVADPLPQVTALNILKRRAVERRRELMARRTELRIGFPRVLNMYSQAPFFMGFFQSLGVPAKNLVYSDFTSEELYKRGAKRGAIDPCFPSKLGIPHVHDLLYTQHAKKPLTHIFFPMIDSFPTFLENVQDTRACPTVVGTAEATHAAFTKEGDLFAERGIVFKKTFVNMEKTELCTRQMYEDWVDELGLSLEETRRAVGEGLKAYEAFFENMRRRTREVIDRLEARDEIGVVVLARPYHNDPGVNHEICEELQKLGYPVLWQDTLPIDADLLERVFGDEVRAGAFQSPLSIEDAWKNSYSENTSRKIWAAKYAARHPNLIALELSSFKCGHDAPIYSTIEDIIEQSGTPYFCFKDIDENKPSGSIKIRIETIAYFLQRYRERMVADQRKRGEIEAKLVAFERKLRAQSRAGQAALVTV
jgi:activator of 2-hydroxyglutaryl-CoA dehydratase/predicted nucleotide-binding protein (sugar kinase/HSP70/actin superfamily)